MPTSRDDREEEFASLLAAYDEALARGDTSRLDALRVQNPQLAERLDGRRECLELLHGLRHDTPVTHETVTDCGRESLGQLPARFGPFQVVRELGRGGSGMVFLAHDARLRRSVALKVPRPEILITSELRERARQEARLAAGLDHPNIVSIYEAGKSGPSAISRRPTVRACRWRSGSGYVPTKCHLAGRPGTSSTSRRPYSTLIVEACCTGT